MFESTFRRVGKFTVKHSKKIIVFWFLILISMAPFSALFLSQTSYDIGGSIVPANSMANLASNIYDKQFLTSAASGASGTGLVIVTNGTDLNDQNNVSTLLDLQNNVSSYLKTVQGFEDISSIFTLENTTLQGFSDGMKIEMNATYALINGTSQAVILINQSANQTLGLLFGIPALYLGTFANVFNGTNLNQAENASYSNTFATVINMSNPVALAYLSTFTYYWNNTVSAASNFSQVMGSAISQSVYNNTTFISTVQSVSQELYYSMISLRQNFTINNFSDQSLFKSYVLNSSLSQIVPGMISNSTTKSFVENTLNTTIPAIVYESFNTSQAAKNSQGLKSLNENLTFRIVAHGVAKSFEYNPVINANTESNIQNYLSYLYTRNATKAADSALKDLPFQKYPVIPAPYVFHQFVGYDNSTTIIIASFTQNASVSVVNQVTSISSHSGVPTTYVAGSSALNQQIESESINGMVRALLIGIVLSVIIVGIFFRSPVAAFIPLSIFGMSAAISMGINGLLYKYILKTSISFITPTLLLILILGLTSDYIVYIMSRYRHEMRKGNKDAVVDAAQWSGHAVFTSGITVALSYIVLWLSNVPIFSDSGLTNAIGVTLSIILANTFLIALLNLAGPKIFWPSKIDSSAKMPFENAMKTVARTVIKNKGKILTIFLISSFLAVYLYSITPTGMDLFSLVPPSSGIQAIVQVNSSFHGDLFSRGYVIMAFASPLVTNVSGKYVYNQTEMSQVTSMEELMIKSSGISQVYGPTYPYGYYISQNLTGIPAVQRDTYYSQINSFIGQKNASYAMISFQLSSIGWGGHASTFLNDFVPKMQQQAGNSYTIYVGGLTQGLNDAQNHTQSAFTSIVPILTVAIFAVLLIQLSSLFTPVRLVLMVLASVVVALSLAYIGIFYILHLPLLIFLPMFTFVTLLAVGLDYDIFMITRVREAVFKGASDEEAIRQSIVENGGVIITLGLLLFATFISLYFSNIGIIQEMGAGLGLGVLIDTFVSWMFFVPTVMLYLKKYNWWPSKMVLKKYKK